MSTNYRNKWSIIKQQQVSKSIPYQYFYGIKQFFKCTKLSAWTWILILVYLRVFLLSQFYCTMMPMTQNARHPSGAKSYRDLHFLDNKAYDSMQLLWRRLSNKFESPRFRLLKSNTKHSHKHSAFCHNTLLSHTLGVPASLKALVHFKVVMPPILLYNCHLSNAMFYRKIDITSRHYLQ